MNQPLLVVDTFQKWWKQVTYAAFCRSLLNFQYVKLALRHAAVFTSLSVKVLSILAWFTSFDTLKKWTKIWFVFHFFPFRETDHLDLRDLNLLQVLRFLHFLNPLITEVRWKLSRYLRQSFFIRAQLFFLSNGYYKIVSKLENAFVDVTLYCQKIAIHRFPRFFPCFEHLLQSTNKSHR